MGQIEDISFIESIGIKEKICCTNMGNVIYLLNNGQKYKEFGADYQDIEDSINQELFEELKKQCEEYGNSLVSFPQIVIESDTTLYGVVGDYEQGTPLSKLNPTIRIKKLVELIEYMENEIFKLSKKGWNLEDIHEENILLNPSSNDKPIRVIDTDFYCLQKYKSLTELYRDNIKGIFVSIIETIIPSLNISSIWLDPYIQENYMLAANGIIKTSDFIKFLLQVLKIDINSRKNVYSLRKTIDLI